jgi:transketolase
MRGGMQDIERKQGNSEKYEYMSEMAKTLRLNVLEMTSSYGGHLSSCFSAVEIMTTLYFGDILHHHPNEPHWSERDRFILSKGHAAPHFKIDNLIVIIDYNKYQQTGPIDTEMNLEPFVEKWRSFNWHVEEIDGHDIKALHAKFMEFQDDQTQPTVIIAHTIKGKGASFVENDYTFHGRTLTPEQVIIAREEILCKKLEKLNSDQPIN